ncbi:MAG TPA: type VI secretion system lipoprotein TssJ [Candidatus Methylomirabilis sp.]|nr:type VI secretion system lipoprotein TssJ [Candidatus Methylomirabilis sp.]
MRGSFRLLSLVCGVALAAGCGTAAPPLVQGSIKADPKTNPDAHGRPSPVVVRVYELKGVGAFSTADFFSLFDKESETLGPELVGREEFDLRPGEVRSYKRQLQPDTKFIGVVAAFRDLENSRWRQSAPVPAKKSDTITVGIEAQAVTVAIK